MKATKATKAILSFLIIGILIAIVYFFTETQLTKKEATGNVTDNQQTIDQQPNDKSNNSNNNVDDTNGNADDTNGKNEQITDEPMDEDKNDSIINNEEEDDKVANENENLENATNIESIAVLVNPDYSLPDNFSPTDLVYPDVRFIFEEKLEKRMLREEAAKALELMFEAAEKDGIYLAGVSGYRSNETQKRLFNYYVDRDGYEQAKTYSAEPGTSEHETGLAIDVSGSTGKCAAQDCFADTVEALWLAENSANYGFIIRYPKGKEDITGYKYEPWHLRYVGVETAQEIHSEGITLEEYYDLVPQKQ